MNSDFRTLRCICCLTIAVSCSGYAIATQPAGGGESVLEEIGFGYEYRHGGGWRQVLSKGADRLCDLQSDTLGDNARNGYVDDDPDDGGWDWEILVSNNAHSPSASPENTYGVTAMGIQAAYLTHVKRSRFLMGMLDAYMGIEQRSEVDSAPDFVFLGFLGFLTGDDGFFSLARQKYDQKLDVMGGSLALAQFIRTVRGEAGLDGMIPYDIGWFAWVARILDVIFPGQGYGEDARVFAEVIVADIHDPEGYFDIDNPHEPYFVLGIACAMHAVKIAGIDPGLVSDLRDKLLAMQLQDGSWGHNADITESDYQTTAYAVQKLSFLWFGDHAARKAARAGSGWLAARQLDSGGFEHLPGLENTEVDAEILFAIYRVPPKPMPCQTSEKPSGKIRSTNRINVSMVAKPLGL